MNRKAVTMAFTTVAILLLLLTLALFYFLSVTFEKTKVATIEEKCQVSVQREATLNMVTKQEGAGHTLNDFATNVECQEIPVDLTSKKESEVAGMTAALMEKCWKMFGSGKKELFSRGEGTFCNKCYVLDTDAKQAVNLEDALALKKDWVLYGSYDVPKQLSGSKQGIVFYYNRDLAGIATAKVYVRALDAMNMCQDAEWPAVRVT